MPLFRPGADKVALNGLASTSSMQQMLRNSGGEEEGEMCEEQSIEFPSTFSQLSSSVVDINGRVPPVVMYTQPKEKSLMGKIWYNRTYLERWLLILLIVCLSALLVTILSMNKSSYSRQYCTSKGCTQAAANLLAAIDTSVDPCQDFYTFACGQWNRDHPIPDDMAGYGTFSYVRERVRQQMRVLLEMNDQGGEARSIKVARITYRGCMNTSYINHQGSRPLRRALEELGGWQLVTSKEPTKEKLDLTKLLSKLRKNFGNEVFTQMYGYADAKNTTRYILYVDQGSLALGRGARDYYLNDTMFGFQMMAYRQYMGNLTKLLAIDYNATQDPEFMAAFNKGMDEVLAFEKKMAKLLVPEDQRRNHSRMYNKAKVGDLYKLIPHIDWYQMFHIILPPEVRPYFHNGTTIIICELEYMKNVSKLISQSDPRIVKNYILWRFIQAWAKLLDIRFDDVKQDFMRVMTGQEQRAPRWKECVPGPINWMPLASGSLYVSHHFNTNDKKEAVQMIKHLRASFTQIVQDLEWMDDETKKTAILKAQNMRNHIGYPDFIIDDQKLDEYYKELDIVESDTYFDLVRKVAVWAQRKEFRKLIKPFDKNEFEVSPAIVNAFYSPEKNAITFPAGILQPPFFRGDYPKAINYGAIGAVIGHEITHGFDDQGSQFDVNGNLNNWWNRESFEGFNKRTRCIIDQYSSYKLKGTNLNVNGILTQGENIADNGGVKEAYKAYKKYMDGKEEPRLPGLDYTGDQLFFLSYAHFWCGHKKRAAEIQQILTDEHSPEIFRVLGVLSNLKEFSDAYKCKPGTPLNPIKTNKTKCTVW